MTRRLTVAGVHATLIGVLALMAGATTLRAESFPEATRVVSIGGSVTEIVAALGEADRIVGRDTTSMYPPEMLDLPDIGYFRTISPEGVLSMSPDLILSDANAGPPEAIAVLRAAGVPFVEVPTALEPGDTIARIETVAEALGVQAEGETLAAKVAADLQAAETTAEAKPSHPKVLFVMSVQGGRIMAAGDDTVAKGLIELAGGENAITGISGYKPVTDEAVLTAAPDFILMMDRGPEHTAADAELLALPSLAGSPAALEKRIHRVDGMLLLGFGPRTAEGAANLSKVLFPDAQGG